MRRHNLEKILLGHMQALLFVVLATCAAAWPAAYAEDLPAKTAPAVKPVVRELKPANSAVRKKLETIVIPTLTVEELPARQVFDLLIQAGRENDPDKVGVNVFFKCPRSALEKRVTVAFDKITLGDALLNLCKVCGLDYTVEEFAVSVFEKSRPN